MEGNLGHVITDGLSHGDAFLVSECSITMILILVFHYWLYVLIYIYIFLIRKTMASPKSPGHPYSQTSHISFDSFHQPTSTAPFGHRYVVSLPPAYTLAREKSWPLILFLHGPFEVATPTKAKAATPIFQTRRSARSSARRFRRRYSESEHGYRVTRFLSPQNPRFLGLAYGKFQGIREQCL